MIKKRFAKWNKVRLLLFASFMLLNSFVTSGRNSSSMESQFVKMNIVGLVVDARTFQPIAGARIICDKSETAVVSDERGFYRLQISVGKGELRFQIRIVKGGYQTLSDEEHWSDFSKNETQSTNNTSLLYFGIRKNNDQIEHFVLHQDAIDATDVNYEKVLAVFTVAKGKQIGIAKRQDIKNKLEALKKGNQLAFLQMGNGHFVVSRGGYIPVHSVEDLVSVDGILVKASDLNVRLKRSDIKSMSTAESSSSYKVIITTKPRSKVRE